MKKLSEQESRLAIESDPIDLVISYGGDDSIRADRGGADLIDAGAGQDYVFAGYGNDVIIGGADSDMLDGFAGNDRIYADDIINVADAIAQGNTQAGTGLRGDALSGDGGNDILICGAGNDILAGGSGVDLLIGGAGIDYIFGDTDWAADSRDWAVIQPDGTTRLTGGVGGLVPWAGNNSDVVYAGAGTTSGDITLSLGSLMLDLGNGDEIHIDNFDRNDVFNSSSISGFEFDERKRWSIREAANDEAATGWRAAA